MNANMKTNIALKDNIQYFADTTYDSVPPQSGKMKLFVLLAYNIRLNKILLCMLALIANENTETLEMILKYLKNNFYFKPDLITVDLGRAGLKAIQKVYPNTRLFPCFFHIIIRIKLHIKNLQPKKSVLKLKGK